VVGAVTGNVTLLRGKASQPVNADYVVSDISKLQILTATIAVVPSTNYRASGTLMTRANQCFQVL
jgi:hypothetical protein